MTAFTNISKVIVEFINRDGIPTALIVDGKNADADLGASIVVSDDGLTAQMAVTGVVPNGTGWSFKDTEDWELHWVRRGEMATARRSSEPGPVAKWIIGIVALAILTPFVAILWAWSSGVVNGLVR